jgi:phosphoglycolate phosphatase-like HAD superfamily hydrolase
MSRFDKLPIYLGWAGEPAAPEQVDEFCRRFGDEVRQAVIEAPWVPGVEDYLREHCGRQTFVLVSATPRDELTAIAEALALTGCFREIHGAPESKAAAVRDVLARTGCRSDQALFVGDADADFAAANHNHVPFLLRRTPLNLNLQGRHRGPSFTTLSAECGTARS